MTRQNYCSTILKPINERETEVIANYLNNGSTKRDFCVVNLPMQKVLDELSGEENDIPAYFTKDHDPWTALKSKQRLQIMMQKRNR